MYICNVSPRRGRAPGALEEAAGGTFSYTKAFTGALVLTIQESRKFRPTCQKQGNGNAPGDVNAQLALCLADFTWRKDGGHVGYTYMLTSAWGFQRCSFRQTGQCESLRIVGRATGTAPRFFVCGLNTNIITWRQGGRRRNDKTQ